MPNSHGCAIWQGCVTNRPVGYGLIEAKFPDTEWHTMHVCAQTS